MHHVKALIGKTSGFMDIMRAMNRKQIPVCKSCHVKIHAGKYSGISLKNLPLKKD
jgi:predicted HNH restriction endonuclease